MGLFGNGQSERVSALEAEVAALRKRIVTAEQTVADVAERAYKWMKKAESRARRELDTPNQEPSGPAPEETPAASSSHRVPWGARGRRMLATLRGRRPDPLQEVNGDGIHS